jgi:alkylated DNA repair dioxygenase AlkB
MQPFALQSHLFQPAASPLPAGFVYQPDFITAAEEAHLLAAIGELPLHAALYKTYTAKRRIASFGAQYDFTDNVLQPAADLPPAFEPLRDKVAHWINVAPQMLAHTLIAEYQPGVQLGWHRDVPQFEIVVGISLGARARMRLRPYPVPANPREHVLALELEPRSAYVLRGDARWRWQHSIPPAKALRYSITFRTLCGNRSRREAKLENGDRLTSSQ